MKAFARTARKRVRIDGGGYHRDHLRALAQRVEVDQKELRVMGSKSVLLRTLVAASSAKRLVLACPVLHRNGALGEIRTQRSDCAHLLGRACLDLAGAQSVDLVVRTDAHSGSSVLTTM
ncbi:MAG TPA: hypothetical protein VMT72_01945 [Pseudolabrys sp.]|nr:hypothetical protein [Pseudolabrys sp.]